MHNTFWFEDSKLDNTYYAFASSLNNTYETAQYLVLNLQTRRSWIWEIVLCDGHQKPATTSATTSAAKAQAISKGNCGVFNSPKKPTKISALTSMYSFFQGPFLVSVLTENKSKL